MYGLEYIDLIKQKNNGKIPIDQLWNVFDKGFFEWYDIPGFYGYQVSCHIGSDDHFIRSYKYKNQYPYGILILPKNKDSILNQNHEKILYQLSDNDNMRIQISLKDILDTVKINPGYPHATQHMFNYESARNKRLGINQDPILTANKKGLVRKSVPVNKQENTAMARFTVSSNPKPLL